MLIIYSVILRQWILYRKIVLAGLQALAAWLFIPDENISGGLTYPAVLINLQISKCKDNPKEIIISSKICRLLPGICKQVYRPSG